MEHPRKELERTLSKKKQTKTLPYIEVGSTTNMWVMSCRCVTWHLRQVIGISIFERLHFKIYLSLIHCFFWLITFRVTYVLMLSHFFGDSSTAHFHSLALNHCLSQPSLCAKMCLSSRVTVRQVLNGLRRFISSLYVSKIAVLILHLHLK